MFNLGGAELVLIAIVAIVLIPPAKLPQLAQTLGRFFSQLQAGFREVRSHVHTTFKEELPKISIKRDFDLSQPPEKAKPPKQTDNA